MFLHSPASVTSNGMTNRRSGYACISSEKMLRRSLAFRSVAMVIHPCFRNCDAISRPKPEEQPVINTTLLFAECIAYRIRNNWGDLPIITVSPPRDCPLVFNVLDELEDHAISLNGCF